MAKKVSLKGFAAILEALPGKLEQRTITAARKTATRLVVLAEYRIRNHQPPLVDRGRLVQSISLTPTPRGAIVRVDAPYAAPLEYGARPFTPPLGPLWAWAKRKGADNPYMLARSIQRRFAREGFAPRRFFAAALADLKQGHFAAEVQKAFRSR